MVLQFFNFLYLLRFYFFYFFEDAFGIDASSSVSFSSPSSAAPVADASLVEEKTEFDLILSEVPTAKRINVIKIVRSLTSLGLKEAKDLIENLPKPIFQAISKEKSEEYKKLLEEAGAIVVVN